MTTPARALFIFLTDEMGGAERLTRLMAVEAARSGQVGQVHCLILGGARSGSLDDLEQAEGIVLHYRMAAGRLRSLAALSLFLRGTSYRLVFSSLLHVNALSSLLRQLKWFRTDLLVARESTTIFDRRFGRWDGLIRRLYWLYGAQDSIICQTETMRDSLSRNLAGKLDHLTTVIPNPVDLERARAGRDAPLPALPRNIGERATRLIWCGRFARVKNPLLAVKLIACLRAGGRSDVHLIMVGDGPERFAVEEEIAKSGLNDHITLTGYCDNPTALMAQADVGLITSEIEGFPNVALEMLASGIRSVISTPCTAELVTIPGLRLSDDHQPASLTAILLPMLDGYPRDQTIDAFLAERGPQAYFAALLKSTRPEYRRPVSKNASPPPNGHG
ncbi:glycosyltransferase [Sphingopyxis macrogoltabida]|uniref:Glycosyltransferase n=1 Tax=Sphingopyxis macrogoltabida TaxID=33050 RepID=A0AAC9FGU1_SPHMC|nr:glycosyltransferase [Sphingopyxis macrogoltabida]ALJ15648.1 hypothetical protein LH19_22470 [Sphingopyxis macrogoltabida]AMU91886.1 hypothetical protein ATM17_23015 [Sphingopyxis macrogoltabida]